VQKVVTAERTVDWLLVIADSEGRNGRLLGVDEKVRAGELS